MRDSVSPQPPPWRRILRRQARRTRAFSIEEYAAEPTATLLRPAAAAAAVGAADAGAGAGATAGYTKMAAAKRLQRARGGGEKHLNFKEGTVL